MMWFVVQLNEGLNVFVNSVSQITEAEKRQMKMITDDFLRRYREYVGQLAVGRCVRCVLFVSLVQVIMYALVVTHIPFPAFLKIIFTF